MAHQGASWAPRTHVGFSHMLGHGGCTCDPSTREVETEGTHWPDRELNYWVGSRPVRESVSINRVDSI